MTGNDSGSKPIRPYSPSLPCHGYEWCNRCHIPSKRLQKPIGVPNPCWDKPGLCSGARKYYRTQMASMGLLMAFCFGFATYEQEREQAWRTPPENTRLFQRQVTRTLLSYHNNSDHNIGNNTADFAHPESFSTLSQSTAEESSVVSSSSSFSSSSVSSSMRSNSSSPASSSSSRKEITIVEL